MASPRPRPSPRCVVADRVLPAALLLLGACHGLADGLGETGPDAAIPPSLREDAGTAASPPLDAGFRQGRGAGRDARATDGLRPSPGAGSPSAADSSPADAGPPPGLVSPAPDPDPPSPEPDPRHGGVPVIQVLMRQAHLEAMLADPWARTGWEATVVFEGVTYEGGTIEVHGNRSRRFPKKSFRLTFPHRITTDFFSSGHPEEHRRLVLQASWVDPTYLRNRLTMALVRSLGGLAPRIEHAVLAVNGEDFGLYTVIERIDKVYLERQGLDPTGNLYKAEEAGADWVDKPDPLLDMEQEINPENPTDDLRHLFEAVTQTPATEVDFRAVIEPLLDLDGYMTWQCVHSFARDMDTFIKNYYLYHDLDEPPGDPAGRFRVISWDADATFGITWNGDPVSTTSQKWHGRDSFAPRLFGIPFYRDRYLALYEAALDGPFSPEQLLPGLVEVAARIAPAAEADLLAWDRGVTFDEALDALLDAVRTRHQVMAEAIRSLR